MKSILKFLGIALLATVVFTACSKDDDPANNDFFAGTYRGSVSYNDGDKNINQSNGSVFVTKVGDRYDFKFSDNIPALTNIEMQRNDNTLISIGDNAGFIRIDEDDLNITFRKDGKVWGADCNR